MLKVIGSQTSPFVRSVRTLCEELVLEYELLETSFYAKMTAQDHEFINKKNPLMRVPVLIDDNQEIFDSRIIIAYLLEEYGAEKIESSFENKYDSENALSAILGIIDAGVLRFILALESQDMDAGYMKRSYERMQRGLEFLNNQKRLGQKFGVAEIALVCALEWFKKRNVIDWSGFGHLVEVHTKFKDRPSLIATRIPESA